METREGQEPENGRNFAMLLASGYFGIGFVFLACFYLLGDRGFAIYVGVYWLALGLGIFLIALGSINKEKAGAKFLRLVGWTWPILFGSWCL